MKLEYLDDITSGGKYPLADPDKLIRLYDFDVAELTHLREAIREKLIDKEGELIISDLFYVQPLNCTLTFHVSEQDYGVRFPPEKDCCFLGRFSTKSYISMLMIIDGLMHNGDVKGFNWLYDPDADDKIDLLLSTGVGSW